MLLLLLQQVEVYFSQSVWDNTLANGNVPLDTVVAYYINQAQKTVDMTIYSFWGNTAPANIKNALISAKNRGVRVRIVAEGDIGRTTSLSYWNMWDLDNAGIPILFDENPGSGIGYYCNNNNNFLMHNKFIVIDSQIVITGSANWSDKGMRINANHIVVIHSRDIALQYIKEFEEMWGSSTDLPNFSNCKFDTFKTKNTLHRFVFTSGNVDSIYVFFSPTDSTEYWIERFIKKANFEINIAMNKFTLCSIRDTLKLRKDILHIVVDSGTWNDKPATNIRGLNTTSSTYCQNDPWIPPGDIYAERVLPDSALLHHKYAIFDRYVVLTGSVNWTYFGNWRNDENMVIIFSHDIANQFFQEFKKRYVEAGGNPDNLTPVNERETYQIPKGRPTKMYDLQGRRLDKPRSRIIIGNGSKKLNLGNR